MPPTFRQAVAQAKRSRAAAQTYRASAGYQTRRIAAINARAMQASAAGGFAPLALPTAPTAASSYSPSTSGCSTALAAAGVSCAQQAGLRSMGASAASPLIQRQRAAQAAGTITSRNTAYTSAGGSYAPTTPAIPAIVGGGVLRDRLQAQRTLTQSWLAAGRARAAGTAYPPTYPGQYTAGGYQTTGPDTSSAPAPAPAAEMQPAPAPAPDAQQQQQPAPYFDPRQAIIVFQQSRTARGLNTVSGIDALATVDALAQQLLMTNDPDARGTLPFTLGHIYQVISEQAVRLGNLTLAQVYASLAARYPAPPAMAGFGFFGLDVGAGGWNLALIAGAVLAGAVIGTRALRGRKGRSR